MFILCKMLSSNLWFFCRNTLERSIKPQPTRCSFDIDNCFRLNITSSKKGELIQLLSIKPQRLFHINILIYIMLNTMFSLFWNEQARTTKNNQI